MLVHGASQAVASRVGGGQIVRVIAMFVVALLAAATATAQCAHEGCVLVDGEYVESAATQACKGGSVRVSGVGLRGGSSECPLSLTWVPPHCESSPRACFELRRVGRVPGTKTEYSCRLCGWFWLGRCCRADGESMVDAGPDYEAVRCQPCELDLETSLEPDAD